MSCKENRHVRKIDSDKLCHVKKTDIIITGIICAIIGFIVLFSMSIILNTLGDIYIFIDKIALR